MPAADLTSIKPHLLRAWLGWCAANQLTPLLLVHPLPYMGLPATVLAAAASHPVGQPLVFSLAPKSASQVGFTAHSIYFTTLFPGQRQPSTVEIPVNGWRGLRVAETGWRADLSFPEQLQGARRVDSLPWPKGTGGVSSPTTIPAQPSDLHDAPSAPGASPPAAFTPETSDTPVRPSLVWTNPADAPGQRIG
jgi:stringent starvation protein B